MKFNMKSILLLTMR